MFVAPFAGAMSDRVSPKRILGIGLALQAIALGWIAVRLDADDAVRGADRAVRPGGRRDGALLRADGEPRALGGGARSRRGRRPAPTTRSASSAACSASRSSPRCSRATAATGRGQTFVDGMTPALWIGAVVVGLGAVAAFAIPRVRRQRCRRGRRSSHRSPTPPETCKATASRAAARERVAARALAASLEAMLHLITTRPARSRSYRPSSWPWPWRSGAR